MSENVPQSQSLHRSDGADADRGSGFAAALERDKKHRERAKSIQPLRRLVPFILAYPGNLALFALMLFAASALTLALPFGAQLVVDCGFGDGGAQAGCGNLPFGDGLSSYFVLGLILAVGLGITSGLRFFFISRLGERVIADLRRAVYDRLLGLSPGFYARTRTGEVLSRLTTDTTLIQTLVGSSISVALRTTATTVGAVVLMFVTNWQLTLMVLVLGPAITVPLILFGRRMQRLSRDSQDRLADASARASETLRGIETVQAFTREDDERARFADAVETTYRASMARVTVRALMTATLFSFVLSGLVGVLWFGAAQLEAGVISGGRMTQFVILAVMAVSGGGLLSETYAEVMRAAGATERLMELLGATSEVAAPPNPARLPTPLAGRLSMDAVRFAYPGRPDTWALNQVSLGIQPGQTVAIVGPSGAGKSTIFQLLTRLYDPQHGRVTLDGVDIKTLDPKDVRAQMALVSQQAPLFAGSVRENIRFGRADASDADVIAAAKAANAHDFIVALPHGYDTTLSEGASNLSGGQRQRVAIARAIVKDAPILLLDEATSALDSESEAAIQQAFEAISASRTSLVIAHRLATVRKADRIIVLDEGRVVDQGTHDELLAHGGLYARLVKLQFGKAQAETKVETEGEAEAEAVMPPDA